MLGNTAKNVAQFIGGFTQGFVNAPANIHTITGAALKLGTVAAEKLISTGTSAALELIPQGNTREFLSEVGNGYTQGTDFERQIGSAYREGIETIRKSNLSEKEGIEITL